MNTIMYLYIGVALALIGAYAIIIAEEPWSTKPRYKWLRITGKIVSLIGLAIVAIVLIEHFQ